MGMVNAQVKGVLEDATRDAIRIVICGEVNSGKSTVLNGLLRQKVLPDFFGESARPYIFVTHGDVTRRGIIRGDGRDEPVQSFEGCDLSDSAMCMVVSNHEHLLGFEIVEVPFLNDKHIPEDLAALIGSADILVWTTIASQAWRLSEKTILDKLPTRPKHAILTVTRADKLRNDADRARLLERLQRETDAYFGDVVLYQGASRQIELAADDDAAWNWTAAPRLVDLLKTSAAEIENSRATGIKREPPVSAKVVSLPVSSRAPAPEPVAAASQSPSLISDSVLKELDGVLSALHGLSAMGVVSMGDPAKIDLIHGERADWGGMGEYCAKSLVTMSQIDGDTHEQINSHVSTRGYQILVQSFPRTDVCLFMVAATGRMNATIARMAFTRICRAYERAS